MKFLLLVVIFLLTGCMRNREDCNILLSDRLKELDLNLIGNYKFKSCNYSYGIGEASESIHLIIGYDDYAELEKTLSKRYFFRTFTNKIYAYNSVNYNNEISGSTVIASKFDNNYYVKILQSNSYTLIYLDDDTSLYINMEN